MLPFVHMATVTHIPIQEYLGSTYRPDCEYVDGEVRERNVGKWEHARVQWLLAAWFFQHEKQWGITGSTEQRVSCLLYTSSKNNCKATPLRQT